MRVGRRVATAVGTVALAVLIAASPTYAALSISVPASVDLGSVASGASSLSHSLGTVTVTASGLVAPSFTATVSTTSFTTGSGSAAETIDTASISYWSGPATATTGLQTPTPGQADAAHAEVLSAPRTAFSSTGLVLSITTAWNPTIVVAIPTSAVAGTYTGTITHSVA